jgi:hypothetical protein
MNANIIDQEEFERANLAIVKKINDKVDIIRKKRNELLDQSDWYLIVSDVILTEDDKIKLYNYRKILREFPQKIVNGIYDKKIHILGISVDKIYEEYFPILDINPSFKV